MDGLIKRLRDYKACTDKDIDQAADALERCREVMKAAEWRATCSYSGESACPNCYRTEKEGHADDCEWTAAIKAIEGEANADE